MQLIEYLKKIVPLKLLPRYLYHELNKDLKVLSGPFSGLKYVYRSCGGTYYPKILGTYEKELSPTISDLSKHYYDKIINIGSGEGYYLAGLSKLLKDTHFISYEENFLGRVLLKDIIKLNNLTSEIEIKGKCTPVELMRDLEGTDNILIIMDVEGYEVELLEPKIIPLIKKCSILVEVHDFVYNSAGEFIKKKYEDTHAIKIIRQKKRTLSDFPIRLSKIQKLLFNKTILKLMDEQRPDGMYWYMMKPF